MRKLFNFISIIMLLWTIIAGVYLAMPQEYRELIPEFNWLTALVSGGSTGILGSTMLILNSYLKRNKDSVDSKYLDLANKFLTLNQKYNTLSADVINNTIIQKETNELIKKNTELLSIDLESKLSNPLIEDFIKEKIGGALNEKNE